MQDTIGTKLTGWQEMILGGLDYQAHLYVDAKRRKARWAPIWCIEGVAVRWNQVEPLLTAGWVQVGPNGWAWLTDSGKALMGVPVSPEERKDWRKRISAIADFGLLADVMDKPEGL